MTGPGIVADRRRLRSGSGSGSWHVVLFPHAGAGASAFFPWLRSSDPDVEYHAMQYPGRGTRLDEEAPTSIPELARDTMTTLTGVGPGPVVLLGHSMGGLVAFETARLLARRGQAPAALVVTGCAAPQLSRTDLPAALDDEVVADWLRQTGGTAVEVLDDPQLLRLILPAVRADLTAIAGYRPAPAPPLTCPILAVRGTEEQTLDGDALAGWGDHTIGPFRTHSYAGDHFAVYHQRDLVLNLVRTLLDVAPSGTGEGAAAETERV